METNIINSILQNQVLGKRIKIVEIKHRSGNGGDHPRDISLRYERLEVVINRFMSWGYTSFSERFKKQNYYGSWHNWCLVEDIDLYNLHQGGSRISISKTLRKNSRSKALLSGKIVVRVDSCGYSEFRGNSWVPYRCFGSYSEYKVVDGVEFEGRIFPL